MIVVDKWEKYSGTLECQRCKSVPATLKRTWKADNMPVVAFWFWCASCYEERWNRAALADAQGTKGGE